MMMVTRSCRRQINTNKLQMLSPPPTATLLLLLAVLGSLPAPSSCQQQQQQQVVTLSDWLKNQPAANAGKDVCVKKDPALSAAEVERFRNSVDPATEMDPADGCYKTITECIASIPDGNTNRYVLKLKGGTVFHEKVFLSRSKPFVTIKSDDPYNPAIIVWNDTAATLGKDGKPLGEDGSATVTIESDYFIGYGVVFRNDAPLPKALVGNKGDMAPALRVLGSKATFYNCTIDGGQGSLYDQKGLHYFKSCTIKGTIDFIFGFAKSLYEDCNVVSVIGKAQVVSLTEGKQPPKQDSFEYPIKVSSPTEGGFLFKTSSITGEGDRIYLGRAGWPVLYSYTELAKEMVTLVSEEGNIHTTNSRASSTFYATFKCYGPGLSATPNYDITYDEAKPFLATNFVSGDSWILSIPPAEM